MYRIQRATLATLSIAAAGTTVTSAALPYNGLLRGVISNAPALDSAHTYTITIKDVDGQTLFTKTGVTANQINSWFVDANNYPLMIPLGGSETVTITSSGTEGTQKNFATTFLIDRGDNS